MLIMAAHGVDRQVGLVRAHEFENGVEVFSPLAANQAVAFARMSRSICRRRSRAAAAPAPPAQRWSARLACRAGSASVDCCLAHPIGNRLRADIKLSRQIGRAAPRLDQFDYLLPESRRIRRSRLAHGAPPSPQGGVHEKESTSGLRWAYGNVPSYIDHSHRKGDFDAFLAV